MKARDQAKLNNVLGGVPKKKPLKAGGEEWVWNNRASLGDALDLIRKATDLKIPGVVTGRATQAGIKGFNVTLIIVEGTSWN